ncbi:V-type H+-transporting ATPase subunit E, partial [Phenoliferia sp. Uapishka_3]
MRSLLLRRSVVDLSERAKGGADDGFGRGYNEQGKIVRQESTNIDANFERKKKQLEIEKKIEASNQNNKSRLTLLESREELLEKVFEEARAKLDETTSDEGKYAELLQGLILQALFTMMEKDITVSGRAKDSKLLKKASDAAAKEFEEGSGYAVNIEIKEDLAAGSAGGVIITGYNNRITVNNTLDERLRLVEERVRFLVFLEEATASLDWRSEVGGDDITALLVERRGGAKMKTEWSEGSRTMAEERLVENPTSASP